MKKIRVQDAVGQTLCHDITAMRDGFKGPLFKRGHVVQEEDISDLLDIGKQTVYIWEDQASEIHEDDAALRLCKLAQGQGIEAQGPSEGKIVLSAQVSGMFMVDRDLLKRVNEIPDITIMSIPNHYPVQVGTRLAAMRIVPLVTQETKIQKAEALVGDRRIFKVLPYQPMQVGVVITGSEIYHGRIQDKFEPVIRKKLKAYPADILGVKICDDDLAMIKEAVEDLIGQGANLMILAGGMSVDPDDLTPEAINQSATKVISHGMPTQPGNMTMVAYRDDITFLGVPGAAISLPTTSLDVLLPQVFTGLPFTGDDLRRLAEGGLCQLCKPCHFPNCTYGRY